MYRISFVQVRMVSEIDFWVRQPTQNRYYLRNTMLPYIRVTIGHIHDIPHRVSYYTTYSGTPQVYNSGQYIPGEMWCISITYIYTI